MWAVVSRVAIYIAALAAPLVISALQRPPDVDPFMTELSTRLALLGFTVLAMQFVISARLRWVERPFGLDQIFRFHKAMAVFAAALLAAHPILLAIGEENWELVTSLDQSWPVLAGKLTLALLLILAVVSLFRAALRFEFQIWRQTHNLVAGLVLVIGLTHAFIMSDGLELRLVRGMIIGVSCFGLLAYLHHMLLVPALARRRAYTVTQVKQETPNVWTLEFVPSQGARVPDYLPGQFHFITLYRERGLPVEEHPFTISSSPTQAGYLAFTIKESGDYTSTISRTKPGDKAALQGPFGRFSHVLHPDERDLVFISGGIGITPLMSMLRYMRDTRADISVHLLCFNRAEQDIAFRDELAAMASAERPGFKVTHILSTPSDSWQGDKGFPDRDMLARLIGDNARSKAYYVCGPSVMMGIVIKALRELGAHSSKIHYERFAL